MLSRTDDIGGEQDTRTPQQKAEQEARRKHLDLQDLQKNADAERAKTMDPHLPASKWPSEK